MTTNMRQMDTDREIVTSRIINATRSQVFSAWSKAEHLKKWWGPAGFTNTFHKFEFKEGGKWDFTMHGPNNGNYPNLCEFVKIEEPALIEWKRFSKPLFDVIVSFEELSSGNTKVVFRQIFATPEECSKIKAFAGDKNEENMNRLEAVVMNFTDPT